MILGHDTFETPIEFKEGSVCTLVVENPNQLVQYISEIRSQIGGGDGGFILMEGEQSISLSLVELVVDPFSLEINDRKILNRLHSKMRHDAYATELDMTNDAISAAESLLTALISRQGHQIVYSDDVDIISLIRAFGVRFDVTAETFLENICEYVSLCSEYYSSRLFIFVNLKGFLPTCDLLEFYSFLQYNKVNGLFIESMQETIEMNEVLKRIDGDLCEITYGSE